MSTIERVRAGVYLIIDENGYIIANIIKHDGCTRPWLISYPGGVQGGATRTLKEARERIDTRRCT